jgi:hypothetical protein
MEVVMRHRIQFLLPTILLVVLCTIMVAPALSAATITSTGTGGNWSATTTWVGGVVPGATDDVIIANGATVTINGDITVASITVGQGVSGILTFDVVAIRKVTVTGNITVAAGGTFIAQTPISTTGDLGVTSTSITNVASTSGVVVGMNIGTTTGIAAGTTVASFTANTITLSLASTNTVATASAVLIMGYDDTLSIGGNLTNNGTFDMSRGNAAGICHVTFTKAGDQTISGSGTTTRFRSIALNKTAVANRVVSSINVTAAGTPLAFLGGTWEQNAGRFTATSGSITVGAAGVTSVGLSITGSGGASIYGNINVWGTLIVNTTDSLIVGTGTLTAKIDLTNAGGAIGTFTKGTVVIYGKFNMANASIVTFGGANFVVDPKAFTATDYAFRLTTGSGTNPLNFTSGTFTMLNPSGGSQVELATSSGTFANISGTAKFAFGQGSSTVANAGNAFRLFPSTATQFNDLTINTGTVGVTLTSNIVAKGKLTVTSCGAQTGAFTWTANDYLFNGSAAQVTGTFMPDSVKNVTINNAAGVTTSKSLTIKDTLFLKSGTLSGTYTARVTVTGGTGVKEKSEEMPREYSLKQNYPNPFNPSTNFTYQVAKEGFVSVKVYDVLGKEVAMLVNDVKPAGSYSVTWNAAGLGSGMYFCKMQSGAFTAARKMILIK